MNFRVIPNSGSSFAGIGYSESKVRKGEAILLKKGNIPEEIKNVGDLETFFESKCAGKNIKNKQLHALVTVKGRTESIGTLGDVAEKILMKLGYENSPYLIFGHTDTDNNHVHIVASRFDENGKRIESQFEGKRGLRALDQILNRNQKNNIEVLNSFSFSSSGQVSKVAEALGYKMDNERKKLFRNGFFQGNFKGIKEETKKQKAQRKKRKQQLNKIFEKYSHINKSYYNNHSTFAAFFKEKFGIEFVYHINEAHPNKPFGLTIIDHQNKIAFKASEFKENLLQNDLKKQEEWVRSVLNEKEFNDHNHLNNYFKRFGYTVDKEGNFGDAGAIYFKIDDSVMEELRYTELLNMISMAKFKNKNELVKIFRKLGIEKLLVELAEIDPELKEMLTEEELNKDKSSYIDIDRRAEFLYNLLDFKEEDEANRKSFDSAFHTIGLNGIFKNNNTYYNNGFVMDKDTGAWMMVEESRGIVLEESRGSSARVNFNLRDLLVHNVDDGRTGILKKGKTKEELERERN